MDKIAQVRVQHFTDACNFLGGKLIYLDLRQEVNPHQGGKNIFNILIVQINGLQVPIVNVSGALPAV